MTYVTLLEEELAHLSELEDGWAGPDSLAPTQQTVNHVQVLLETHLSYLPFPDITPNENGTVSLEWFRDSGYVLLEVGLTKYGLIISNRKLGSVFRNGLVSELVPLLGVEFLLSVGL